MHWLDDYIALILIGIVNAVNILFDLDNIQQGALDGLSLSSLELLCGFCTTQQNTQSISALHTQIKHILIEILYYFKFTQKMHIFLICRSDILETYHRNINKIEPNITYMFENCK